MPPILNLLLTFGVMVYMLSQIRKPSHVRGVHTRDNGSDARRSGDVEDGDGNMKLRK